MDWDRLSTQMIREMIRQFLREPGEFLSFNQLAFRISGSDKDLLQLVAESRTDLFAVARNGRALKLHTQAVERILGNGIDNAINQPETVELFSQNKYKTQTHCGHFSEEELLPDLYRCSLPGEALVRNCCWAEICRIRSSCQPRVAPEIWSEICQI